MTHTRTLLLGAGLLCLGAALIRRPGRAAETPAPVAQQRPFGLANTLNRAAIAIATPDCALAREIATLTVPPGPAAAAPAAAVTTVRSTVARMEAAGERVADLLRERRAWWERPNVNAPRRPVVDVRAADDTHVRVHLSPTSPELGYEGGQAVLALAEARVLRDALSAALEIDDLRRAAAAAQAALDARLAR